jgi:hypothetical protein
MTPSPDLKARVLAAVSQVPAPDRNAVRRRAATYWVAAGVGTLLVFGALGGLRAVERPLSFVLATGAAWAVIALAVTLGCSARGSMVGRPVGVLLGAVVVTPLALGLSYWVCVRQAGAPTSVNPLDRSLVCMGVSLVFAAGPFAVLAWSRRNLSVVHPRATAAAMGAVACAWASVLIDLHCESCDLGHVWLGHVGPVVVLALVGFLVGDSFLGVHAKAD